MNIYDNHIHNYRDVRTWLTLLRYAEEDGKIEKRKEHYDEIKRAIRRFYKKVCDRAASGETVFGEFDSYTRKYPLPEVLKTKEEAKEYFEEYEWMECAPSQYDCTGQHFTHRYVLFQRDGRWWCYHVIGVDV